MNIRNITTGAVLAVFFMATTMYGAEENCFWEKPGVQYLVAGPDIDKHFNDSAACRETPRLFAGDCAADRADNGGALAFITRQDELFVSVAGWAICPLCVGCRCYMEFTSPRPVPVPGVELSEVTSIAVVKTDPGERHDSVAVRIALVTGAMEIIFADVVVHLDDVVVDRFSVSPVTRHTLSPGAVGQRIVGVSAMKESGELAVFGAGGLWRVLEAGGTVREKRYDIDPAETVLCEGDGYIGTKDGSIYRREVPEPVAEIGRPLRTVSARGAGGDHGLVVAHVGDEWAAFEGGELAIRHVEFINTRKGKEAFVVDTGYMTQQFLLYDTPTSLEVSGSPDVAAALNKEAYWYDRGGAVPAQFTPVDPEGNFERISVQLHLQDTVVPIVDTPVMLQEGFSMVFSEYKVIFGGKKLVIQCDEITCHELAGSPFSDTVVWSVFDSVVITAGSSRLCVVNGISIAVKRKEPSGSQAADLNTVAGAIVAAISKGVSPSVDNRTTDIRVYSCQGKLMRSNRWNNPLSPGMYILRIRDGGRSLSRKFQVVGR